MARPSLGQLLWASDSTRPLHVDGSGAATWTEKMIYSKVSIVSPDPRGKVSDPCIYENAFIPFVSFGDLDNNTFKGLTSLLSVKQEIQYDEHT